MTISHNEFETSIFIPRNQTFERKKENQGH